MPSKLTQSEAESRYRNNNFILNQEYIEVKYRHSITCMDCGATNNYSLEDLSKRKKGCTTCTDSYQRYTISQIKEIFDSSDFKLIGSVPKTTVERVKVVCGNGHESLRSAKDIKRGSRCYYCIKVTLDRVKECLSEKGYELLSEVGEISNQKEVLTVRCKDCGYECSKSAQLIVNQKTKGCLSCAGKLQISEEDFAKVICERELEVIKFTKLSSPTVMRHTVCGKAFEVRNSHNYYYKNVGCPHCADKRMKTKEELNTMLSKHGWYLDKVPSSTLENVELECTDCGYTKTTELRRNLYNNINCPSCGEYKSTGFREELPALLYYIKVVKGEQVLYKVGVTNHVDDVTKRFQKKPADITISVLMAEKFEQGSLALDKESLILEEYISSKYCGEKVLGGMKGNTELFTHDILHLDNQTD